MQSARVPSPIVLLALDEASSAAAGRGEGGVSVVIQSAGGEQQPGVLRPAATLDTPARLDADHNIEWTEVTQLKDPLIVADPSLRVILPNVRGHR
jgi:hypothetical protein